MNVDVGQLPIIKRNVIAHVYNLPRTNVNTPNYDFPSINVPSRTHAQMQDPYIQKSQKVTGLIHEINS